MGLTTTSAVRTGEPMNPSHVKDVQVRPFMQIVKDIVAKYGWYLTRWGINWKSKESPYIFAYMAFPKGYVLHETNTVEDETTGVRAQVIVFREESLEDPRKKLPAVKAAMAEGGYL